MTVRVLVVIGTRPEAIKLAPVIEAMRREGSFDVKICVTSQHTDLLAPALSFFQIPVDYDLAVMTPGQTLEHITSRVVEGLGKMLRHAAFELVIVQGDTNTAFAASLAAFYEHVAVAHVEAGLRSSDLARPFPEEANRRLIDVLAQYRFAPTEQARNNLLSEGFDPTSVFVTGNTGIDAVLAARRIVESQHRPLILPLMPGRRLALVTVHRRESFGPPLVRICEAVRQLAQRYANLEVVLPVHPNPKVRGTVEQELVGHDRVHLLEPLAYPDFVRTMLAADLILSDSGGVQEEASALGKRVLVLREVTERVEGVRSGWAEMVGTDVSAIMGRAAAHLQEGLRPTSGGCPYGDGQASLRILKVLRMHFASGFRSLVQVP